MCTFKPNRHSLINFYKYIICSVSTRCTILSSISGKWCVVGLRSIPIRKEGRKEMFCLMTHSTHFIYGYMASDIWLRTILIARKETRCWTHINFRLTARLLLYAPSHRQNSTFHSLCYTSRGALAGTRNSSMGSPHEGSIRRTIAPWANTLTMELWHTLSLSSKSRKETLK